MGKLQENLFWISDQSASVLLNWFSRESFSLQLIKLSLKTCKIDAYYELVDFCNELSFAIKGKTHGNWTQDFYSHKPPLYLLVTKFFNRASTSIKIIVFVLVFWMKFGMTVDLMRIGLTDEAEGVWFQSLSALKICTSLHSVHTTVIFIVSRNAHVY